MGWINLLTSIHNARVKQWRKLHQRKHRERNRKFLVEGFHLIEEAYKSNWPLETIIVTDESLLSEWMTSFEVVVVNETVFNYVAQTKTPQGIIAVVNRIDLPIHLTGHVLLLDAIQDPGNLGTIIRTADAAGFSAIYLGLGTVDLY